MNRKQLILFALGIALLVSCSNQPGTPILSIETHNMTSNNLSYTKEQGTAITNDNYHIAYRFYKTDVPSNVTFVLLHMLGSDQSSYDSFVQKILEQNNNVVTFDFRGHGASQGNWKTFSDKDFEKMQNDLNAVIATAKRTNVSTDHLVLIGASIGANIALLHAVKDPDVQFVIMLSPGLNYRGITINQSIEEYGDRAFEFVASKGDTYSYDTSRYIMDLTVSKKASFRSFEGNAHGTDLLTDKLMKDILEDSLDFVHNLVHTI